MWAKLVAAFARMVQSRIGYWFATLLVALGIGFATHGVVVEPVLDGIRERLVSSGGGEGALGVAALQWAGFLNLDKAITLVLSAMGAKAALRASLAVLAKR